MANIPTRPADWVRSLNDPVASMSWSPDGRRLAVLTTEGRGAILDAADGTTACEISGHEGGGFRVAWNPSGASVASSGQDGCVRFWDPASGAATGSFEAGAAWVEQLAWAPGGAWLAATAGRKLVLWSESKRGVVHSLADHKSTLTALEWRRDGRALGVACYGTVRLYLPESGKVAETLPWKTSLISLALSPDNRWIVAGTQEQSVQIWELPYREGEELAMSGYAAKVRELSWHHSGRYLATGGGESIMVWDCGGKGPAGTSPRVLEGHAARINALAYPSKGHVLASADQAGQMLFWNAGKSSTPLRSMAAPGPITALAWAPGSDRIAFGGHEGSVGVATAPTV